MFKVGERVTEANVKHLKQGDILQIISPQFGIEYSIFDSHVGIAWMNSQAEYYATVEETKECDVCAHSLQDMGIIPNKYNGRQTYWEGNINKAPMPQCDNPTKEAILESIAHHKDNLEKLKVATDFNNMLWCHKFMLGQVLVAYGNDGCALCRMFVRSGSDGCPKCPLAIAGFKCDTPESSWTKLRNAETKQQAIEAEEGMIKVLRSLIKEEIPMSQYNKLKSEIEQVTGWDKKADDILDKMGSSFRLTDSSILTSAYIEIPTTKCGNIFIFNAGKAEIQRFHYSSQCEKLEAFKQALMYLLNCSDIKKDLVGQEIDAEIEGKVYKVKVLGGKDV